MIRNKYLYVVLVVMSVLASCSPDDRMGLEEPIQDLKIIVIPAKSLIHIHLRQPLPMLSDFGI